MKHKIFCEVCRVAFIHREPLKVGMSVICTVCGTRLEILQGEPVVKARRLAQDPEIEIRERVENFARLRGYRFNEDKESLLAGLLQKYRQFGDFYCPCRFEHNPDNVCPCLETRMNRVRKEGSCY